MSNDSEHSVAARTLQQSIGRLMQSFDTVQLERVVKSHLDLGTLRSLSVLLQRTDQRLTGTSSSAVPPSSKTTLLVRRQLRGDTIHKEERDLTRYLARFTRALPVGVVKSGSIGFEREPRNASVASAGRVLRGAIRAGSKRELGFSGSWQKQARHWRGIIGSKPKPDRSNSGEEQKSGRKETRSILSTSFHAIAKSGKSGARTAPEALRSTVNGIAARMEAGGPQSNSIFMPLPRLLRRGALSASAPSIKTRARAGRNGIVTKQVNQPTGEQVRHSQEPRSRALSSPTLQRLLEALSEIKRDQQPDAEKVQPNSRNPGFTSPPDSGGGQMINYSPTIIVNGTSEVNDIEGRVLTALQNHSYELSHIIAQEAARRHRSDF